MTASIDRQVSRLDRRGNTVGTMLVVLVCVGVLIGGAFLLSISGWFFVTDVVTRPPAGPSPAATEPAAGNVAAEPARSDEGEPVSAPQPPLEPKWVSLFNGKDLSGWQPTEFGGEGDVSVEDGRLILEMGNDMTGVTIDREIPKINYVVELEAMRADGLDFFCGLTFPVNEAPCSLIVGGWGGGLCGLSSINGLDASENSTTTYREFDNGKWYKIRCRVTDDWIEAWLDEEQIVSQNLTDVMVGIRPEVELSRPFGIATWRTKGALRNIRIRPLSPKEIDEVASKPVDE